MCHFDNSIYEIEEGEIKKKYTIDFKGYTFPHSLIQEENSATVMQECNDNEYVFSMSNALSNDHHVIFMTNLGMFVYDKKHNALNGYKLMLDTNLGINMAFPSYMVLENTNKIVCVIDDPSSIKQISGRIPKDKRDDESFSNLIKLGDQLGEDNNPVLFIYQFND